MKHLPSHKLGANRNETAHKARKHAANFSQSRDIREDRGERKEKFVQQPRSVPANPLQAKHERDKRRLLIPEHSSSSRRQVLVKLHHSQAHAVNIAGTFNDWHPLSTPLRQVAPDEWTVELLLDAGIYEYRFVVDGQWTDDPAAQRHVPNGFGGQNGVLVIAHL